jgi:hypothetical protein
MREGSHLPGRRMYRTYYRKPRWGSPDFIKPGEKPDTSRVEWELVDYYQTRKRLESDRIEPGYFPMTLEQEELLDWDRRFNAAVTKQFRYKTKD